MVLIWFLSILYARGEREIPFWTCASVNGSGNSRISSHRQNLSTKAEPRAKKHGRKFHGSEARQNQERAVESSAQFRGVWALIFWISFAALHSTGKPSCRAETLRKR